MGALAVGTLALGAAAIGALATGAIDLRRLRLLEGRAAPEDSPSTANASDDD